MDLLSMPDFAAPCIGHLESSLRQGGHPNVDKLIYSQLQALGNCQTHSGGHKFSKILMFAWKLNFIFGNKILPIFPVKTGSLTLFIFNNKGCRRTKPGNCSLSDGFSFKYKWSFLERVASLAHNSNNYNIPQGNHYIWAHFPYRHTEYFKRLCSRVEI